MAIPNLPAGHVLRGSESQALADDVNNLTSSYSRYTGTTTTLINGAWKAFTWPTLSEGTGQGLSVASQTTFTLTQAGVWLVTFSGVCGTAASHTGTLYGLFTDGTFVTAYGENHSPLLAGQAAGHVSAEIKSDGTFTVVAACYGVGAAPSMLTAPMSPRLTFSLKTS